MPTRWRSSASLGSPDRRQGAAETLLGRVGTPADVAEAVLYLARAGFVTGTSLVVDGGRLLESTRGRET